MSNLGTWVVSFRGFKTLDELTGLTFTQGTTYQIQFIDGYARVRQGTEGNGFKVYSEPFLWECGLDSLYIGMFQEGTLEINIDEKEGNDNG